MNVLLVEDNKELSAALQASLMTFGHKVTSAFTLAEARLKAEQIKADAVVLDLGLPDGDGYEFVRYVRAQRSDLPILILTARSSIEERIIGMKSGADDYVTKPFAMDELMARLEVLVRRLRPEDESELQEISIKSSSIRRYTVRSSLISTCFPPVLRCRTLQIYSARQRCET